MGNNLNDDSMKIEKSNNKIILDGLPIFDVNHPENYHFIILKKFLGG